MEAFGAHPSPTTGSELPHVKVCSPLSSLSSALAWVLLGQEALQSGAANVH